MAAGAGPGSLARRAQGSSCHQCGGSDGPHTWGQNNGPEAGPPRARHLALHARLLTPAHSALACRPLLRPGMCVGAEGGPPPCPPQGVRACLLAHHPGARMCTRDTVIHAVEPWPPPRVPATQVCVANASIFEWGALRPELRWGPPRAPGLAMSFPSWLAGLGCISSLSFEPLPAVAGQGAAQRRDVTTECVLGLASWSGCPVCAGRRLVGHERGRRRLPIEGPHGGNVSTPALS